MSRFPRTKRITPIVRVRAVGRHLSPAGGRVMVAATVTAPTQGRGKSVVVTGGAGFIGSHLCEALLESDHAVMCVDNLIGTSGTTRNVDHLLGHPRFQLRTENVLDWAECADLSGVSCIFHLAASKHS